MLTRLHELIKDKKILILGFGREGRSTLNRILEVGDAASITIADGNEALTLPAAMEITTLSGDKKSVFTEGISLLTGIHYMDSLDDYDIVFKSPGVVLPKAADDYPCLITSQTEVFFEVYREQIIGITGTKGKSTTSTLLYYILRESGMDTVLAGNIGIPFFDILEQITPASRIVCELSCHQLEYIHVSPHIAILLNIHEEHLDHYGTMEKYVRAKEHIFLNQTPEDVLICSVQCLPEPGECVSRLITAKSSFPEPPLERFWKTEGNLADRKKREEAPVLYVEEKDGVTSICYEGRRYKIPTGQIRLLGQHNYFDIGMAYAVCSLLGMAEETFTEGLKEYEPLPHRLQFLGEIQGVKYYDDSISTICETAIQALKTLKDTDAILIGGMDRGIDYRELIEYLSQSQVPHIILMEATGKRIFEEIAADYPDFENPSRLLLAEHLKDAVCLAKKVTRPGRSCVMSPAAASYGIFRNFEERGEEFKRLVLENEQQDTVF